MVIVNVPDKNLYLYYRMPYTIRKVRNKNCYSVRTTKSKRVMAKCSTKENAKKQVRLLRAMEVNKDFARKVRATRKRKRGNN